MAEDCAPATEFRCVRCRNMVFTSEMLDMHPADAKRNVRFFIKEGAPRPSVAAGRAGSAASRCPVYNITKPSWLPAELCPDGRITCPHKMRSGVDCGAKLGEYKWHGTPCPCGVWMAPAFFIPKSKVDCARPVFNAHPIPAAQPPQQAPPPV